MQMDYVAYKIAKPLVMARRLLRYGLSIAICVGIKRSRRRLLQLTPIPFGSLFKAISKARSEKLYHFGTVAHGTKLGRKAVDEMRCVEERFHDQVTISACHVCVGHDASP